MKKTILASFVVLTLATLACSPGTSQSDESHTANEVQIAVDNFPAGDTARGKQIFLDQPCHSCHTDLTVGPAFPGDPPLAVRAETRREDYSSETYLYESIIDPNAYIVSGFQKDIMPDNFSTLLTDQDLADLIAYLMTMK